MSTDTLFALMTFCFVSSITPGPNNLMIMASGANFGFRRSLPHLLGIALGFVLMVFLVGLGLAEIFDRYPVSHTILKVLSVTYMLWLAWKIANAAAPDEATATGTPLTFLQAAAFQWVNPKAWAMSLQAISLYAPDQSLRAIIFVAAVFGIVNLPSIGVWNVMGIQLRHFLTLPSRLRAFNWTMAALLVASLLLVLI